MNIFWKSSSPDGGLPRLNGGLGQRSALCSPRLLNSEENRKPLAIIVKNITRNLGRIQNIIDCKSLNKENQDDRETILKLNEN